MSGCPGPQKVNSQGVPSDLRTQSRSEVASWFAANVKTYQDKAKTETDMLANKRRVAQLTVQVAAGLDDDAAVPPLVPTANRIQSLAVGASYTVLFFLIDQAVAAMPVRAHNLIWCDVCDEKIYPENHADCEGKHTAWLRPAVKGCGEASHQE